MQVSRLEKTQYDIYQKIVMHDQQERAIILPDAGPPCSQTRGPGPLSVRQGALTKYRTAIDWIEMPQRTGSCEDRPRVKVAANLAEHKRCGGNLVAMLNAALNTQKLSQP